MIAALGVPLFEPPGGLLAILLHILSYYSLYMYIYIYIYRIYQRRMTLNVCSVHTVCAYVWVVMTQSASVSLSIRCVLVSVLRFHSLLPPLTFYPTSLCYALKHKHTYAHKHTFHSQSIFDHIPSLWLQGRKGKSLSVCAHDVGCLFARCGCVWATSLLDKQECVWARVSRWRQEGNVWHERAHNRRGVWKSAASGVMSLSTL